MKLSKLNLVRMVSLTILTAFAALALHSPSVAKADEATAEAHKKDKKEKEEKVKHREMTLEMTCNGPCMKSKGNAGESFCIEATTDLAHPNWQPICAQTVSTNGQIEFTDSCASNYPTRFYRVTWSNVKDNNGHHYGEKK